MNRRITVAVAAALLVVPLSLLTLGASDSPSTVRPPDLFLYVIDALRQDRLGIHGHPGGLTPGIDEFARSATTFRNGRAQSSWTRPAIASLLTGLLPQHHRVWDKGDVLDASIRRLPERLAAGGYATAAFVTNGNVAAAFGFGRGFEHFEFLTENKSADSVRSAVWDWYDRRQDERPVFVYLHTIEPHAPYSPPAAERARFAAGVRDPRRGTISDLRSLPGSGAETQARAADELLRLYDAEVAAADGAFGRFLTDLRRRELDRRSLLVLTADHGEEFQDHGGWSHGKTLHAEVVDIPLIVRFPAGRGAGRQVEGLADHVDIHATFLLAAQLDPGDGPGRPLQRALAEGRGKNEVFSHLSLVSRRVAVETPRWKLIGSLPGDRATGIRIFDRELDPRETLGFEFPDPMPFVEPADSVAAATAPDVPARVRDELRALGYLP